MSFDHIGSDSFLMKFERRLALASNENHHDAASPTVKRPLLECECGNTDTRAKSRVIKCVSEGALMLRDQLDTDLRLTRQRPVATDLRIDSAGSGIRAQRVEITSQSL